MQNARFNDLRAALPPGELLTARRARTLLTTLGLSTASPVLTQVPATRLVKRGEVAALRWSLLQNGAPMWR